MLHGHKRPIGIALFVHKVIVSVREEGGSGPLGGGELNFDVPPTRVGVLKPIVELVDVCYYIYFVKEITGVISSVVASNGQCHIYDNMLKIGNGNVG
jgi:hypothetical protein